MTRIVSGMLALLVVVLGACSAPADDSAHAEPAASSTGTGPSGTGTGSSGTGTGLSGRLDVFAAASLTEAFERVADDFTAAHPDVDVVVNPAGSSTLATQITQGAPADVFVSADAAQMAVVEEAGLLAGAPVDVAGNRLSIAVEPGNPLGIEGLADLARPDVTVVLAAEEVPAGNYTEQALAAAGVQLDPASREPSVRAVRARVALGEADAGVVYASDIAAGDDVEGVTIPADVNVTATYPAAALTTGDAGAAAAAFVDHLRSRAVQDILRAHGFTAP